MKTIEELENELEELKKEFYFFSKDGSSSGGSTPPIKPPTPSDDGWIVIYDMRSTDSAVNLGKTGGIHSYENYIEPIPDLFQYSKIIMTYMLIVPHKLLSLMSAQRWITMDLG